ncbi:MAG: hypothetical protein WDZ69_01525 [Candidatus Pacearchaeota archaeon]
MDNDYGMSQREKDFYERNEGKYVDLMRRDSTISGIIESYDRPGGKVRLSNVIWREYNSDGSSYFTELEKDFEADINQFNMMRESSEENHLGRIVKYGEDLKIENLERERKLRELRELNINLKRPNN